MCKQIDKLLSLNALNKKESDSLIGEILANICFGVLDGVSHYIYKEKKSKQSEYTSYCGQIFNVIEQSVKEAHKSKSFEEFEVYISHPINNAYSILNGLADKYPFIEKPSDDPELLVDFNKKSEKIYNKFFKKAPRKRKARKYVK